ncbi:hypothetical protein [Paraburkholderia phenazinium]|jgi:hypothetical protein|uniref:hypothetical protein n=1 Tax=Paraburkholderia phenazinium TaxID=60549 RepID=UPI000940D485|nr:hypothetical protein [Paraburkholderia phenazinium]
MKRIILRVAYVIAFIVASVFGGLYLGRFVFRMPFWVPDWLFYPVQGAAETIGLIPPEDGEDAEAICGILALIACISVVALTLRLASILIARHVRKRRP